MTNEIHVFEKHGLGKAPYAFLGVQVLRGPITLPDGTQVGSYGQPMGSCQYCNTGIAYLFWLQSADGKKFYVGSDCIHKSGDAGLRAIIEPIVAKHNAEMRDDRNKMLINMFSDLLKQDPTYWTRDTRPHPYEYYARQGRTYGEYQKYIYEHAGMSKKASLARQLLIAANVPLPDKKRKKSGKRDKNAVPVIHTMPGMYGNVRIIDLGD